MLHEEAWRHLVGGWHELVLTDDCEVSAGLLRVWRWWWAKWTLRDHFLPQATFQSS